MLRRETEAVRLPNEVVERLSTSGTPKNLSAIRKAEGSEMTLTTHGLRALNQRAEEEIRAFQNSIALDEAHGKVVAIEDLRSTITELESQNRQLRDENTQLRAETARLTAKGAMAISSGGTER